MLQYMYTVVDRAGFVAIAQRENVLALQSIHVFSHRSLNWLKSLDCQLSTVISSTLITDQEAGVFVSVLSQLRRQTLVRMR